MLSSARCVQCIMVVNVSVVMRPPRKCWTLRLRTAIPERDREGGERRRERGARAKQINVKRKSPRKGKTKVLLAPPTKEGREPRLLSAALHFSLCCSVRKSKRGHKAGRIGEQPDAAAPPAPLLFPITATTPSAAPLVPKSHVAYPPRGRGGAVGKHRGTTEPICLCCLKTLNYSLKPPEFLFFFLP